MGHFSKPFHFELPERYNVSEVLSRNIVAGRGEKVAIYCGDRRVTYAQLEDTANRFGNGLKDLGPKPGARILLLLPDIPEFPAAFFGAAKAGYVPVPCNTVLHPVDYEYFIKDSGTPVMVVDAGLYPKVEPILAACPDLKHLIVVDGATVPGGLQWDELIGAASPHLDPADTSRDDPAFWLYSSGSTGFPKGAVHLQHDIPYTIETYARHILGITEDDLVFSASKIFHAYGLGNSMSFSYGVGAGTVLYPGRPTPEAVFGEIRRFRPTLFFTAPTLYAAMLAAPEPENKWDLSGVRLCVSAAESLPADVYSRWRERFGIEILDGIGSTEMLHIFISNRSGKVVPGSSGTLVPGYDAKIVDENDRPVPVGEMGDLLVRGDSAASMYWNQPQKTAFTMRGDWLFTGDRYRMDAEDNFYYEGRSDDMFKVGGLWVSPIEVENVLAGHPAVQETAVVAMPAGGKLVKTRAFVVLTPGYTGSDALAKELQDYVKARIAPYKYPRVVEFVDDLPKTATGKIQRFRLRE